jgi:hypothetical protein
MASRRAKEAFPTGCGVLGGVGDRVKSKERSGSLRSVMER